MSLLNAPLYIQASAALMAIGLGLAATTCLRMAYRKLRKLA
jgi:hypothetical protein